jgi:flagellar biosynthesis chaperone FliJ
MKKIATTLAIMAVLCLAGQSGAAKAQQPYRLTEKEVKELLSRIDRGAERFRNSLDKMLDVSTLDGTKEEDNINSFMKEFAAATEHLKHRFDDKQSASGDVEEVLRRAARIDGFMARRGMNSRALEDWNALRADLDQLASAYNVSWDWAGVSSRPFRLNDEQVKRLLGAVEREADSFRKSLDSALDKTDFDHTKAEDNINDFVKEFERATDHLKDRFSKKESAASDAEEVLRHAARIDVFMQNHRMTERAQEDWRRLRQDLDELALAYNVSWKWM